MIAYKDLTFSIKRKLFIVWPIFILFLLSGCSNIASYRKAYVGPMKSLHDVAILTCPSTATPNTIDGREAYEGVIELTPGSHNICAKFFTSAGTPGFRFSAECVSFTYEFSAGHVYELYPIFHTHKETWVPAIWDVTADLKYAEKQGLLQNIKAVLEKNRGIPVDAPWISTATTQEKLPGYGETRKADNFVDRHGRTIILEYNFYRYKPFTKAKGSDGNTYHIEISQQDGQMVKVLGKRVILGDFWKGKNAIYQPVDSDLAYEYQTVCEKSRCTQALSAIFKEVEPDQYKLIKKTYVAVYAKEVYTFLLDETLVEGLPESASQALVLMYTADPSTLYKSLARAASEAKGSSNAASALDLLYGAHESAVNFSREASCLAIKSVQACIPGSPQHTRAKAIESTTQSYTKQCKAALDRLNTTPQLNSPSTLVRFFESPQEILPFDQRRYSNRLARSKTRFVTWELYLKVQPPDNRMEYVVCALWKNANGQVFAFQTRDAYLEPHWTQVWNAHSYGWQTPGNWSPGNYSVELYIGRRKIAIGQFQITSD